MIALLLAIGGPMWAHLASTSSANYAAKKPKTNCSNMKPINLGYTPGYELTNSPTSIGDDEESEKKEPSVYYPSMTIEGEAAKKLVRSLEAGEEVTATVNFRVREVAERSVDSETRREFDGPYGSHDGCRVELSAKSIEFNKVMVESKEDEYEESAEEAIDRFRSEKKK